MRIRDMGDKEEKLENKHTRKGNITRQSKTEEEQGDQKKHDKEIPGKKEAKELKVVYRPVVSVTCMVSTIH